MIMLRDIYTGDNICAFDNETDAFEMVMSLVEEKRYEEFQELYLMCGYEYNAALYVAEKETNYFIEALYFQEFPYIDGNCPYIKEE